MRPRRAPAADQCVVMLSQDSFYRNLTEEDLKDVKSEGGGWAAGWRWWWCRCC